MIKSIVRDVMFLGLKSEKATAADMSTALDLIDTLKANRAGCVGMAANMIGVRKRIIIVNAGLLDLVMFNPVITAKKDRYETTEGCLSLAGQRNTVRYQTITVSWQDMQMKKHSQTFTGWTAQIIQHECDHLDGIII